MKSLSESPLKKDHEAHNLAATVLSEYQGGSLSDMQTAIVQAEADESVRRTALAILLERYARMQTDPEIPVLRVIQGGDSVGQARAKAMKVLDQNEGLSLRDLRMAIEKETVGHSAEIRRAALKILLEEYAERSRVRVVQARPENLGAVHSSSIPSASI